MAETLAQRIRASQTTGRAAEEALSTDQRVLARITDGIYRQPASALRELISNAYDADATEVVIYTDAPRFEEIVIRDDGDGMTPETLDYVVKHIGGSSKRTAYGGDLNVTDASNVDLSPGGRKLIGKLGIGLFSVAQFTRHFQVITKTRNDSFRTIADITLGPVAGSSHSAAAMKVPGKIDTGHVKVWREPALNLDAHGTEIRLLNLLPRTRAELSSADLWTRIDFERSEGEPNPTQPPEWHIGRMMPGQSEILAMQPNLPWEPSDDSTTRFKKLVDAVREAAADSGDTVDLDSLFDRYLQSLWTLALACPLSYVDEHPFDLKGGGEFLFFELENNSRGQAQALAIPPGETPRQRLCLDSESAGQPFSVVIDGIRLSRPVLFAALPKAAAAFTTPLLFVGREDQVFAGKPVELSGGRLRFEAYLFWAPRIVPKQHQGVALRVGNASGSLFDRTFLGYQVSEQTRLRQITAEIFVTDGLDDAINLDRESFNYAHPHYQYLVKWLHSALRQFANRHKTLGTRLRAERTRERGVEQRAQLDELVASSLADRGCQEPVTVVLLEPDQYGDSREYRNDGKLALRKERVMPPSDAKQTQVQSSRQLLLEKKAAALTQVLHSWGLLSGLSMENQEALVRDILRIATYEGGS